MAGGGSGGGSGGGGTGTVTSVSVATANGYSGTVATPTTTPVITISGGRTTVPSQYTTTTVTANPNPAVIGTYYRANYASSGAFTLPSTSLTIGQWVMVKNIAANTLTIAGTVDGNASYTLSQYVSATLVWNGTTWDAT